MFIGSPVTEYPASSELFDLYNQPGEWYEKVSFSSQPIFDSIQMGPSITFDFPYTAGGSVIPGNFDFDRQHRVQRLPLRHGDAGRRPRARDMGHDASRLRQPRVCGLSQEKRPRRRPRPSLIGSSLIGSRRFRRPERLRKGPAFSPGSNARRFAVSGGAAKLKIGPEKLVRPPLRRGRGVGRDDHPLGANRTRVGPWPPRAVRPLEGADGTLRVNRRACCDCGARESAPISGRLGRPGAIAPTIGRAYRRDR